MRTRLLSLCVLATAAGCSSRSAPGPTAAPENQVTAPPAPTSPAPTVQWVDDQLVIRGLPAVADDGNMVLIPSRLEDGARGFVNLTLTVKDRRDEVMHRQVVLPLDATTVEQEAPTRDALADAATYLERTHREQRWQPMPRVDAVVDRDAGEVSRVTTDDGVELRWTPPRLTVTVGGAVVVERDFPAWESVPSAEERARGCANPSFLAGAHVDAARRVALVEISYFGDDSCWEPDSEDHVVAW